MENKLNEKLEEMLSGMDKVYSAEGMKDDLEAVRYLKSQHYIGSEDAFNLVKGLRVPRIVSRIVNDGLCGSYRATPERASGLLNSLREAYRAGSDSLQHEDFDTQSISRMRAFNDLARITGPFSFLRFKRSEKKGYQEIIFLHPFDPNDLEDYARVLIPLFESANSKGIGDDSAMGFFLPDYVDSVLENPETSRVFRNYGDLMAEFRQKSKDHLSKLDYEYELSKREFMRASRDIVQKYLPVFGILKRICREQIGHKMEYKRKALSSYVSCLNSIYEEQVDDKGEEVRINNSEDLIKILDADIVRSISALENKKQFDRSSLGRSINQKKKKTPEENLLSVIFGDDRSEDHLQKEIESLKYLRNSVVSERRFVDGILR